MAKGKININEFVSNSDLQRNKSKIFDIDDEAYIRILEEKKGKVHKLSDYDVRGDKANKRPVLDDNDGWE